ncbi:MAG: SRPBCC family protein [Polyangiaceae bacterium]
MNDSETTVTTSVLVNVPIEHAFKVFTERFDLWWPRTHHIAKVEMQTAVLEQHEGGRWFERGVDGSECEWGRVLAYAPPTHVAVSWHLTPDYGYDPDPAKASRVDVRFHAEDGTRTRVELVHSLLDRHGEGWQRMRDSVGSSGGWGGILAKYVETTAR